MNIETLVVLLVIALIAALIGRAVARYSLSGCLTAYVAACLGAVGGWWVQQQYFWPDRFLMIPLTGAPAPVSIIGASAGALLLAFIAGLIGRPAMPRRRARYPRR